MALKTQKTDSVFIIESNNRKWQNLSIKFFAGRLTPAKRTTKTKRRQRFLDLFVLFVVFLSLYEVEQTPPFIVVDRQVIIC